MIYIHWKFDFLYFVGRAIHEFKILTKYFFILVIWHKIIILNPHIQVSMNMSNVVMSLNHETKLFHSSWNFMVNIFEPIQINLNPTYHIYEVTTTNTLIILRPEITALTSLYMYEYFSSMTTLLW